MIDLRTDTLTQPTNAMRKVMMDVIFGDDRAVNPQTGRGTDASANALEDEMAALLGKEEAVLFPSGTMANTAALTAFTQPGDAILLEKTTYSYCSENFVFNPRYGQCRAVFYDLLENGHPDPQSIAKCLEQEAIRVLELENTQNYTGGVVLTPDEIAGLAQSAHAKGVRVHLDGARLFNAAVALDVPLADFCKEVDSVMVGLSKAPGAPLGAVLAGTHADCRVFRDVRKILGGSLRYCGWFAAPARLALEPQAHIVKDHVHAKKVEAHIADYQYIRAIPVESNLVVMEFTKPGFSAADYCARAYEEGLWIQPAPGNRVRLVFYKDITDEQTEQVLDILDRMEQWCASIASDVQG